MLTATVTRERAPALAGGVYIAVCTKVIDLGIQYNERFNKSSRQVKILWNIVGETIEINGEEMPRQINKDFTVSLDERSTLRKMLQSWRGKPFTAEELQGFDLKKLLGASCQLQLIQKTNEHGTYAVVENIMALPAGTPRPKAENTAFFDLDDPDTYGEFASLPRYIQEKIAEAENFGATGLKVPERAGAFSYGDPPPERYPGYANSSGDFEEIGADDDLPF